MFDLTIENSFSLERKRNFLFSLKQSSSIKFEESSVSVGNNFVLSESGMSFGGDELSITWTGDPEVKNIPGGVFGIPDLDSMIGTQQFTADDFEVLQPKGGCFAFYSMSSVS